MFIHPHIKSTILHLNIPKLEFAATVISPTHQDELIVITIYRRSNTISTQHFKKLLGKLLSDSALHEKTILVLGDFNEDLMENRYMHLLPTTSIQTTYMPANYKSRIIA